MRSIGTRQGAPPHGKDEKCQRTEPDKERYCCERSQLADNDKNTQDCTKRKSFTVSNNALLDPEPFVAQERGKRPCTTFISHDATNGDNHGQQYNHAKCSFSHWIFLVRGLALELHGCVFF